MSDEKFKMNIKQWVDLDNQHKQYNEILKEIERKSVMFLLILIIMLILINYRTQWLR